MDFSLLFKHYDMLLRGAQATLEVTFGALALGLVLGILAGTCRISRTLWIRLVADAYIQIIRGTPMLLQIFFSTSDFRKYTWSLPEKALCPIPL